MNISGFKPVSCDFFYGSIPGHGFCKEIRPLLSILMLSVWFGLTGCASLNIGHTTEQSVGQVAEKYWAARVAGDWITCYKYEEVSKLGKIRLSEYVQAQGNLIYKSAKIDEVKLVSPKEAQVKVRVEYFLPAFGTSSTFKSDLTDVWVNIDGNWFHHTRKKLAER